MPALLEFTRRTLSPSTHFGKVYRKALQDSATLRVLLEAVAVELHTDAAGARVDGITVKRSGGRRASAAASRRRAC